MFCHSIVLSEFPYHAFFFQGTESGGEQPEVDEDSIRQVDKDMEDLMGQISAMEKEKLKAFKASSSKSIANITKEDNPEWAPPFEFPTNTPDLRPTNASMKVPLYVAVHDVTLPQIETVQKMAREDLL